MCGAAYSPTGRNQKSCGTRACRSALRGRAKRARRVEGRYAAGYPVCAVRPGGRIVAVFVSIREAAERTRHTPRKLAECLASGRGWGGLWWRYADMPAACQPLKPGGAESGPRRPVPHAGHPSRAAAARAMGVKPGTLRKRLARERRRAFLPD